MATRSIALDFTDAERKAFWKRVRAVKDIRKCWLLRDAKVGEYGTHSYRGAQVPSHRLSYAMAYAVDPGGSHVLHACDDRRCQNPRHLRLGSAADNNADRMVARMMRGIAGGWLDSRIRAMHLPGIRIKAARPLLAEDGTRIDRRTLGGGKKSAISDDGAQSIRWCYWNGCQDQIALAASHAVTELVAANVVRRDSKGHLPPVPGEPDPRGEIAKRAARWNDSRWFDDGEDDHIPTLPTIADAAKTNGCASGSQPFATEAP